MSKMFESKHRGSLGPGQSDFKEIRMLNKVVTRTREGILYDADQRDVEICSREMRLDKESREDNTPIDTSAKDNRN